jgi:uncharacterized protein (TIGR02145 family)
MRFLAFVSILLSLVIQTSHAQDTVKVYAGWNIIGSLGSGVVPESLVCVPAGIITTTFYGYHPGAGYEVADTLEKGAGYWLKVSADGIVIFEPPSSAGCGSMRIVYEGVLYHTIQVGSRCWLEENLNVGGDIVGTQNQSDNGSLEKYCYGNDPLNCVLYGGLYQWDEAMQYSIAEGARGICPPGWHIPTSAEFTNLKSAVSDDGNALKSIGQGNGGGAGTNTSGFSALLGGDRDFGGLFTDFGQYALFWGSTGGGGTSKALFSLVFNSPVISVGTLIKNYGASVRCIQD